MSGKRRQRDELLSTLHFFAIRVIDARAMRDGRGGVLEMNAWRREGDDLFVNTVCLQHALAVVEIAMAGHQDVVVAGIVQPRILLARHSRS